MSKRAPKLATLSALLFATGPALASEPTDLRQDDAHDRIRIMERSVTESSGTVGRPPDAASVTYASNFESQASTKETQPILHSKKLPVKYDYLAPDGSEVRLLVRGEKASMAQFKLPPGHTSSAVAHHSVEELWYVASGRGQLWRKHGTDQEDVVDLVPGVSISLSPGTHFQFRSTGSDALEVIGVTVPPWPGADEAYSVDGKWPASSREDRPSNVH